MKRTGKYVLCMGLTLALAAMACNLPALNIPSATRSPTATVTFSPQDLASPTKNSIFLPQIQSGSSITSTPGGAGTAPSDSEARVDLSASSDTLRVGETVTLLAKPVGIGMPYYYLNARDQGVQNADPMVQVTYDNQTIPGKGSSNVLEFVSAQGAMDKAEFVLRAKAPGLTTLTVMASGEIQLNQAGKPYVWNGAGSGTVVIKVNP